LVKAVISLQQESIRLAKKSMPPDFEMERGTEMNGDSNWLGSGGKQLAV
jgi:hypothetical protein